MGVIYINGEFRNANLLKGSINQNCSSEGLDAKVEDGNLILDSGSTTDFLVEDELLTVL